MIQLMDWIDSDKEIQINKNVGATITCSNIGQAEYNYGIKKMPQNNCKWQISQGIAIKTELFLC